MEGVDNHGEVDLLLAEDPAFTVEKRPELLGGIDVIHGKTADGEDFTAVPLYVWDNRIAGKMNVWLRQKDKDTLWHAEGWKNRLYRPYVPKAK